jgi:hypothetical protein
VTTISASQSFVSFSNKFRRIKAVRGPFLSRLIALSIDVAISSNACFAASRTGAALQRDTTA